MIAAGSNVEAPYRGLAPFGDSELDALLFFGRERETAVTTAHLIGSRLTVLYGPSGVGKSSLLRAGVARRIRELGARRAVGRGPDLACVVFASWALDDPVRALADAIGTEVASLVSPTAPQPPPGSALADVAEHWTALLDGDLCLVLDQFEEYFVYHDAGDPRGVVAQVAELVARPSLRVNVLLSLRDDELARLDVFKASLPHVFANPRRLDRLDHDGARAAILGPLQRWNESVAADEWVEIEDELVEAVLTAAAAGADDRRVEAPFLQLVMERVWNEERLRGSHALRLSTLTELGGPETLVREHLDRALAGLDDEQQDAVAAMFGHLVTPSGTKIAHRATDLATVARIDTARGRNLLAALDRERIVRPLDGSEGGGDRYEIFHDVLAGAIVEWTRRRELDAERVAARRRQRRLAVLAGVAFAGLAVTAALALYARAQEQHARADALAAKAFAALPTDPEQSLVLARRAAGYDRSRQVEDALRAALIAFRGHAVFGGHSRGVLAVGFTRAGIGTLDRAGTLREFPPRSAPPRATRRVGGRVRAAAFAPDGDAVAIARRRLVTAIDPVSGAVRYAFREQAPIRAIAVDADAGRVAAATIDGRVTVRARGHVVFSARAPFAPTAVALDGAGRTVAASGRAMAAVWAGGRRTLVHGRSDIVAVALSPDGATLATAGVDGDARLWRVRNGTLMNVVVTPTALTGATFSRDGGTLALEGRDGTVRVYDVETGRPVATLAGHHDAVTTAAFSATGRSFVTGSADGTARLWDSGVAPELRVLARPPGCCAALTSTPAGALVAAGKQALLYRLAGGVTRFAAGAAVTAVASSGDLVVTGGSDGRVQLWRADGTRVRVADSGGAVLAVAASPKAVVAAYEGRVVHVLTGRAVRSIRESATIDGLAISHDDRTLAEAGADGVTRIRDLRSGRLVRSLVADRKPLTAVAFSPDDDVVATSSYDHDVRLWSVRTGKLLYLLRAHFAVVSDVAFSADGRWLVTAGPTTAGLWRVDDGSFVAYLRGHARRLVGAGFLDGDREIVTASVDGTVRGYHCDVCGGVGDLLDLARQRLAAVGS